MKIVINTDWGGFGLSKKACEMYAEAKGIDPGQWNQTLSYYSGIDTYEIARDDPDLVSIVETLGKDANGSCASLRVVEIPDGVEWSIHDYDGIEHIAEKHRTWR